MNRLFLSIRLKKSAATRFVLSGLVHPWNFVLEARRTQSLKPLEHLQNMNNWSEIKNRILFSYMGCDWTSISVDKKEAKQIKEYLDKNVNLEMINDDIYKFENAGTDIYFYLNSDQHFDFDPKTISSEHQWSKFLDTFKKISKDLESNVLFRPEDSNSGENIIIKIIKDEVQYDFKVYEAYKE